MTNRIWHKGPPPNVGWWNASLNRDKNLWRFWDGESWSGAAAPQNSIEEVSRIAKCKSPFSHRIEWTDYWPEGARVPRLDPIGELTIELMALELLAQADRRGLNVTIERRPLQPLAMGHTEAVVNVWPKRGAA